MTTTAKRATVKVSDTIGSISVLSIVPKNYLAMLVLAHGAGAGMEHFFMEDLAVKLAEYNVATIRYNFPFKENMKARPDSPAIAERTVHVVVDWVHQKYEDVPVFVSGKSFGGRMSSQALSKDCPQYVKGIIFYGFPLHGIGKESTERAEHLKAIRIPMLFLQGTKDKLAKLELIQAVCSKLPGATLTVLEGADHSFKVSKKLPSPDLSKITFDWITKILSS